MACGAPTPMKCRPPSVVRRIDPHGGCPPANWHGAGPSSHHVSSLIAVNDWGAKCAGIGVEIGPGVVPGVVPGAVVVPVLVCVLVVAEWSCVAAAADASCRRWSSGAR